MKKYPPTCGVPSKGKPPTDISKEMQQCVSDALLSRANFLRDYQISVNTIPVEDKTKTQENIQHSSNMPQDTQKSCQSNKDYDPEHSLIHETYQEWSSRQDAESKECGRRIIRKHELDGGQKPLNMDDCKLKYINDFSLNPVLIEPDNSLRYFRGKLVDYEDGVGLVQFDDIVFIVQIQKKGAAYFSTNENTLWFNKSNVFIDGFVQVVGRYVSNEEAVWQTPGIEKK